MKNFKSIFFLPSILIMFFLIQNLAYGDQSIEGVWKGSAWGDFLKIEFKNNKKCNIEVHNKSGEILVLKGTYELDFNKKPIPLSIRNVSNLNHPLHTIIRFVDDDTVEMMKFSFSQRFRPIFFSDEKKIRLKRNKIDN